MNLLVPKQMCVKDYVILENHWQIGLLTHGWEKVAGRQPCSFANALPFFYEGIFHRLTRSRSRWRCRQTFNPVPLIVTQYDTICQRSSLKSKKDTPCSRDPFAKLSQCQGACSRCVEMGDATRQPSRLVCHTGDSVPWFLTRLQCHVQKWLHCVQHEKEGWIKNIYSWVCWALLANCTSNWASNCKRGWHRILECCVCTVFTSIIAYSVPACSCVKAQSTL